MAEWHYAVGGQPVGPVEVEDVENMFRERIIDRDTLVWTEGMPGWRPMHEIPAFHGLTRQSLPPPLPDRLGSQAVEPDSAQLASSEMRAEDTEQVRLSNIRMSEPQIPWTRYFARVFDVAVLGSAVLTVAFVAASYLSPKFYLVIYTADPRALLLIALPAVLILNAVVITVFGNSAGKKLFGIHTVNSQVDRPFTLTENIARELRVWIRGLAFGIPLINLITMIPAFRRVSEGKPTLYDEGIASVRPYSHSPVRRAIGMLLTVLILLGIAASNAIDKQNLERASRPYTWTNPVTSIATTIPGGWESETIPGPSGTLYAFTNLKTGVVAFLAVEDSAAHTLVSYAEALEASLSKTMTFEDWSRYDLPGIWQRTAVMKDGSYPAALLLGHKDKRFWRVVYVDQVGIDRRSDVEDPELTRALFASTGVK